MRKFRFSYYGAILLIIIGLVYSQTLSAATFSYKTVHDIKQLKEGEIWYLSLSDLADALGLEINFDPVFLEVKLSSSASEMTMDLFSSYVKLDNKLKNIIYPILYRKADFYVPAITLVPLLSDLTRLTLVWDNADLSIRASESKYNVLDLRFSPKSNGFLCEVLLTQPLEYEVFKSEGSWLQITLQGGKLDVSRMEQRPRSDAIRRIRAFQFNGSAQISIDFRGDISEFRHSLAANPPRIQISIIDTLFDYASLDSTAVEEMKDSLKIIVLDAGHGGAEDGAIGPEGIKEKEVVLDLTRRLADLLGHDSNLSVILTRETDTTLLLEDRARIANNSKGSMFVSIHVNSFPDHSAKGTQTFFLASALNDAARATAMLENRSVLLGRTDSRPDSQTDLDLILFDLLQTEYLSESQSLAADIQAELIKSLKTRDRGVDQAGFFLLNQVYMPAVLVEVAFISNKHEEVLLNKDTFRQKAAEGIYQGIKKFIDKYDSGR